MEVLKCYSWPGNVRELQNAMERACALCNGDSIELSDLPPRILHDATRPGLSGLDPMIAQKALSAIRSTRGLATIPLKEFLHHQELFYIEQVVEALGGDKDKAAELLDVSKATLYRKMCLAEEELPEMAIR